MTGDERAQSIVGAAFEVDGGGRISIVGPAGNCPLPIPIVQRPGRSMKSRKRYQPATSGTNQGLPE